MKKILAIILLLAILAGGFSLVKMLRQFSFDTVKFVKAGASYRVGAQYPKITDKRLSPNVRQKANTEIDQFTRSLFERDLRRFIESGAKWTPGELKKIAGRDVVHITFKIVRLDKNQIHIRFEKFFSWIGAAHGVTKIIEFKYDLQAEKVLAITTKVSNDT